MSWASRLRSSRTGAECRFPVLSELTSRLVSGNLLDAGTCLAAQTFLAAVPLLFAVAAFAPHGVREQLSESLRAMFGLTGPADRQVKPVLEGPGDDALRETSGIVGILVALVSATSFSRAMARVCERAFAISSTATCTGSSPSIHTRKATTRPSSAMPANRTPTRAPPSRFVRSVLLGRSG